MKIVVFSDIHGSKSGADKISSIVSQEKPNKVVVCGDYFGGWSDSREYVYRALSNLDCVLYLVKGNNDYPSDKYYLPCEMEDYAVMHHFGRVLFFTHGDCYNKWSIPPVLRENDAIVYGHTHCASVTKHKGLFCINVGSIGLPRDGCASYVVLDEQGIWQKSADGKLMYHLPWHE